MRVLCTCALCVCECACVCMCATKPQTTVMKFQLSSLSCAAWVRVCVSVFVPHCVCVCVLLCVCGTPAAVAFLASKSSLVPRLFSPRLALPWLAWGHPQHLLHTHEHGLWQPQTHTSTCTATLQNQLALTLLLSALAATAASTAAAVRFFASTLQPLTGREARLPRRRRGR